MESTVSARSPGRPGGLTGRLTVLLALGSTACGASIARVAPGEMAELAPGVPVELQGSGLRLTLLDVQGDSRCPVDVTCISAGNALVRLHLERPGEDSVAVLGSVQEPRSAAVEGGRIELVELLPARRAASSIAPSDYRARIRWSRP